MSVRLPNDLFERYLALGSERSYQQLADALGVSKQAITKRAVREQWQQRIDAIEAQARTNQDARAVESLEQINERRMKEWTLVERRALETIRNLPFESGADAVRALDLAHKNMRLIRGEPTERTESIEHVIRGEYTRWLTRPGGGATPERSHPKPAAVVEPAGEPGDEPEPDEPEP